MLKFIQPFLLNFNFYRSLWKLKQLEQDTLQTEGNLFKIPFTFEGYDIFNSIRPKQVIWEIKKLYDLVEELDAEYICEIGTFRGGTFYLWCKVAREDATLISIDLSSGSLDEAFSPDRRRFYQKFAKSRQQQLCFLPADSHQRSTAEKVSFILGDRQLDFLFIDGDHSYEGVKQDFELYSPFVRTGGIIAFHDILPRPEFPNIEVYRLWNELKAKYSHQEIIAREGEFADFVGIGVIWI
jgi:predicted O-methyltransferase YrrM